LTYDPLFLDVYLNGVRLVNGASNDFVATNGTSIVLNSGASAGDILNIVSFGTFTLASFSTTNITSGTLPTTRGGTGLSSLGTSGQALVVNSSSNALEFSTIQASEITTVGNVFSNYNTISADTTITTASTKNMFLKGVVSVTGNAVLTIAGNGTLEFI